MVPSNVETTSKLPYNRASRLELQRHPTRLEDPTPSDPTHRQGQDRLKARRDPQGDHPRRDDLGDLF